MKTKELNKGLNSDADNCLKEVAAAVWVVVAFLGVMLVLAITGILQ